MPFNWRQNEQNRILARKNEDAKSKEVEELEKAFALENTKERFDYADKTLKEYGGLESHIPLNHPYWKVRP